MPKTATSPTNVLPTKLHLSESSARINEMPSPMSSSNIDLELPVKRRRNTRSSDNDDIKSRCMPFFRKFWTNLGEGDNRQTLHPNLYGRPVEEVDPFVFEDESAAEFQMVAISLNQRVLERIGESSTCGTFST
ncbi:unnamed protein product [Allacma fusca]|uniref:Uncharacterized protein n=1 Tax=Allacma fusca TaxID=39272 RepID=A0A8J2NXB5_9HEXA|nr:unnamed protein product [Allacma fusca]